MTTSQHTPAPWVESTDGMGDEICTIHSVTRRPTEDGKGQMWVYIRSGDKYRWLDETENDANARLIAQAPVLLNLVERMLADGQFYLTAVEAQDEYASDFEAWARDARAAVVAIRGSSTHVTAA